MRTTNQIHAPPGQPPRCGLYLCGEETKLPMIPTAADFKTSLHETIQNRKDVYDIIEDILHNGNVDNKNLRSHISAQTFAIIFIGRHNMELKNSSANPSIRLVPDKEIRKFQEALTDNGVSTILSPAI